MARKGQESKKARVAWNKARKARKESCKAQAKERVAWNKARKASSKA